ncbi:MAG: glycoside hydrolase family 97 catalytic domain-containing protein [Rikenellaceae bacterium]
MSVTFNGEKIVAESELGFNVDGKPWCTDMQITGTKNRSVNSSWQPVYGERSTIIDKYNETTISFEAGSKKLDIVARAYNEGVAFRYSMPEQSTKNMVITSEQSTFTMPDQTKAYYSTWAQGPYELLPLSGWEKDTERPLTMILASGKSVAIGEAAMVDYARSRFNLDPSQSNTLVTVLASDAKVTLPYSTPWRTIMAGEKVIDIVNNNDLFLNLNEPCAIENTSWIKPGKVFRTGLTMEDGKAGVDFAAARGLQYVHFDAGWYGPERDRKSDARIEFAERDLKLKEICDYAATKGIGVLVYVNKIALSAWIDEILPIYKEWGIKGIKFGFVDVGSQEVTNLVHEWVVKCAKYEMLVDIHDEYRPTGFSRTYPNLMTQEGIRGNEEMPDAFNNLALPFTRYVCGAGDYTLCYFSNRIQTTRAHQLAMAAVYYSPLQFMFWYDKPTMYRGEKELEYWANVPAVWDDSRTIEGAVGEYITTARRTGSEWFVGAMTNAARTTKVNTSEFLTKGKKYKVTLYQDNPKLGTRTNVEITTQKITAGDVISLDLLANGGAAMHFVEM